MPKPYSNDLRWRIVWKHLFLRMNAGDVARVMCVSERSVYRYAQRFLLTGDVRLFHKSNGPSLKLCEYEQLFLVQLILTKPGIYLSELQEELYSRTMQWVDASTICRCLHRIGLSHQKIKYYCMSRSENKRAEFWAEISHFDPSMIVWVDETGCELRNALRKYGYGIRGMAPQDFVLKLRGNRYSAVGILTTGGIEDVFITEGNVNGEVFLNFVRKCLLPILMPFDGCSQNSIVILDNASIHHMDSVVQTIQSTGALVRFLPPYSPDMNPIEEVFGEIKQYLQANVSLFKATTSPKSILLMAFGSISVYNCNSYITHAGYT